ncbi:hypothetical protein [Nocardia panacis]|nr:hypothetical protein [Nocardia panacis]
MSHTWSTDPDENIAIDALGRVVRAMTELLHHIDDARYLDPAGGFNSQR